MKILNKIKTIEQKLPLVIHPAFLVVAVYCAVFSDLLMFVLLTFLALFHELGHAIVAARYGYKLRQIRLLPFGAELCGDDLFLSSHEIKIALAGPLTNLFFCIVCVALMWVFPSFYVYLNSIFSLSLSLALFNLLPFFPLDGGRIFVALISKQVDRKKAVKIAAILSFVFGIVLLLLFALSIFIRFNISFGIMGVSLVFSSLYPSKNSKYFRFTSKSFKDKKLQSGLAQRTVAISKNSTILVAFCNIDARSQTIFSVQDASGKQVAVVSEYDIEKAINSGSAYKKIGEYFIKNH